MSDYNFLFIIYINDCTKILWYNFLRKRIKSNKNI